MRLGTVTPLFLAALAACWDRKHPRELVGTWARDSLYGGGILRGTDTFRLRSDGNALRSGGTSSTAASSNPSPPTSWAVGLKWDYRPRVGGSLLCLFVEEGQEPECHVVIIASESVLVVDGRAFQRLRGR